ncbi:GH32 C-terminal domain-containing protein [Escherichia coli]
MPNITDYSSALECGCILITNLATVLWRYYPHENLDGYRSIPLPQRDTPRPKDIYRYIIRGRFINDGEAVMSSRIYPQPEERELSLYASHGVAVLQHGALWLLG